MECKPDRELLPCAMFTAETQPRAPLPGSCVLLQLIPLTLSNSSLETSQVHSTGSLFTYPQYLPWTLAH